MKLLRTIFTALVMLPFMVFASVENGAKAPDFAGVDTDGKTISLFDYKDDTVVLEWTNHECPFVKKFYDIGHMQEVQKTYTDKGIKWIRIISSAPGKQGHVSDEKANEVAKAQGAAATHTLRDESGQIGRLYGAKTTPHMFVIDKGMVVYQGAMDDKRSASSAAIVGATPHLTDALDALLAGKAIEVASSQPYGCSVKY